MHVALPMPPSWGDKSPIRRREAARPPCKGCAPRPNFPQGISHSADTSFTGSTMVWSV